MTFRDKLAVSIGNLLRMKLRTFLTTSGVVIAIAAFVSMLSFGAGNQKYITEQFDKLGLFSTMQVYPKKSTENGKSSKAAVLDRTALEKLSQLHGVNLAYPYDAFTVTATVDDSVITSKAQALGIEALRTKLFSGILAGKPFADDSAREVLVTKWLLDTLKLGSPDSVLGKRLVLSMRVSSIDSGLARVPADDGETVRDRLKKIKFDSLRYDLYRRRIIRGEVNGAIRRFLNGFLNARDEIRDTFTICGVLGQEHMGGLRIEPIIVPTATALKFSSSGFSSDPAELFTAMSSGTLLPAEGETDARSFSQVTLDLDPRVPFKLVKDSVEAMGFRAFSFAEQFSEIQKFFFYFDLALGVIGLIALITASLGIINTMVMSILERKREIGVLKSLGADDSDIRFLFLVESGVIGAIGAGAGIFFGWLITRVASGVAHIVMQREGIPPMELFALPLWLILIALAIGIGVSLLAGAYPAGRAARVDPVEALRND